MQTLLGVVTLLTVLQESAFARAELPSDLCPERNDEFQSACRIGLLAHDDTALKGSLDQPGDVDAYQFEVGPLAMAANLTLTDISSDAAVSLYAAPTGTFVGQAQLGVNSRETAPTSSSLATSGLTIARLEPGTYTALVYGGDLLLPTDDQGYTLRIALSTPTATAPPAAVGQEPTWKRAGFQLGLTMDPVAPTSVGMVTFGASVDAATGELFDFTWELDGTLVPDASESIYQVGRPALGHHTVRVTATPREVQDREAARRPPTLVVASAFDVR